ncbi:toll/interleukin-1 receptor domain-containing protein [Paenibacillus sp. GCM10012306]|uniref:toll/interleukin-1 receptor domain-containing protein n=1 Tax=Paenibacillus sp. GCM10012306 TaxID=3317342 RepID=UPI00361EF7DB
MIFLCFSGKDRETVVRSILYHLENYGINVWYDYHEHYLGDNKFDNYVRGIKESKYAIIVISEHFFESSGAIEEIEVIYKEFQRRKIHIFPIFYKIKAKDLPSKYDWLSDLIYNEVDNTTGTLAICNQIICKFLKDTISFYKYADLADCYHKLNEQVGRIDNSKYLSELINTYYNIDRNNLNGRITILYSLFLYISNLRDVCVPKYVTKSISYLFNLTKLDLISDFKELTIVEYALVIYLNQIINIPLQGFEE